MTERERIERLNAAAGIDCPRSAEQWHAFVCRAIEREMTRQGARVTGPELLASLARSGFIG